MNTLENSLVTDFCAEMRDVGHGLVEAAVPRLVHARTSLLRTRLQPRLLPLAKVVVPKHEKRGGNGGVISSCVARHPRASGIHKVGKPENDGNDGPREMFERHIRGLDHTFLSFPRARQSTSTRGDEDLHAIYIIRVLAASLLEAADDALQHRVRAAGPSLAGGQVRLQ